MHKVFGIKEKGQYIDREGAYLIPIQENKIAVIKTGKGYFLIGGGLTENESHEECIKRECFEESGYNAIVKEKICSAEAYIKHPELGYFHPVQHYYLGNLTEKAAEPSETGHILMWVEYEDIKGNMFAEMQNWALKQCVKILKG